MTTARNFAQLISRNLARSILKKYRPEIIAITGSIGKSSTKEACFRVLKTKYSVYASGKNYNTEIGVPLAIIGVEEQPGSSLLAWLKVFSKAFFLILLRSKKYPRILILELAADKPGDIGYFLSWLAPKVGLVTAISQVHLANYAKFSQIIAEKRQVIESLPVEGYAVLNLDDPEVAKMAGKTKAKVITYGVEAEGADLKAQEVKVIKKDEHLGLYFKLLFQETATPIFVKGTIAPQLISSFLAAAACGIIYKLTPFEIAEGLDQFKPLPGRFQLLPGIKQSWLIDDTYNAAPVSTVAAIRGFAGLPVEGRKIAVLADMLETGSFTQDGHEIVGREAAKVGLDWLLTYGPVASQIIQSAKNGGFPESRSMHFDSQTELISFLEKQIKAADVVLVKGSHGMHMEAVINGLSSK